MAGDFTRSAGRLVTERNRANSNFMSDHAAEIGRQRGIVIARNPDPVAPRLQRRDRVAVMKAVAERNHHARIMPRDHGGEAAECRHRIVGRQQHAAGGKTGALFQMQIGDDEQALFFPEQCAGEIGDHGHARDINGGNACHGGFVFQRLRARRHSLSSRLFNQFVRGFRQQLVGCFAIN